MSRARGRAGAAALVLSWATLAAHPAAARELFRRGDAVVSLTGSVRELLIVTGATDAERFTESVAATLPATTCVTAADFADCPAFGAVGERDVWDSLTRVRTRLDLTLDTHWSAALVYDHELRFGILDTLEQSLAQSASGSPLLDLQKEIHAFGFDAGAAHRRWRHLMYRAYVRYESERLEVVAGRQRIAWGVGRLWNPIDRFNAIPPLALEADQSGGVDAIDVRWRLGGFSYLEAAWAPGRARREAALALRLHGSWRELDYSLIAGRFQQVGTAGFDVASNVGGAAARLEVVYADPRRKVWPVTADTPRELAPYWQAVASVDYQLDVGSGLYVLVEHLYNGNALGFGRGEAGPLLAFFEATERLPETLPPAVAPLIPLLPGPFVRTTSADRFGASGVVSFARHQTGLQLGYDLSAAWRADFLTIYDWNGASAVFFPRLLYTPLGSLEVTLGAQLVAGGRRSQYGGAEPLFFLLMEFFY